MRKNSESHEAFTPNDGKIALREIMDKAIMLKIANEYLCESPILERIGKSIKKNIVVLTGYSEYLKKQFIGKPLEEVDIKDKLEPISDLAALFVTEDKKITKKCLKGQLGEELEKLVTALTEAFNLLIERVEGRAVSFSIADSVSKILSPFKTIFRFFMLTTKYLLKTTAIFGGMILVVFFYLFFTMESEKKPIKEMAEFRNNIQNHQNTLSKIEEELNPLLDEKERIRNLEWTRELEIKQLDLNVKVYKLTEKRQQTQILLKLEEEKLGNKMKELERIRQKPFLSRLLKM